MVVVIVVEGMHSSTRHAIDLGISLLIVFAFGGPVLSLLSPLDPIYCLRDSQYILTELPRKPNRPKANDR